MAAEYGLIEAAVRYGKRKPIRPSVTGMRRDTWIRIQERRGAIQVYEQDGLIEAAVRRDKRKPIRLGIRCRDIWIRPSV